MAHQTTYRAQQDSFQNTEQAFARQNELANQLQAQAAGSGPSAAQALYKQAAQNQAAQASALAASQQGNVNAGLATRGAQQAAAQANQQAAGNAAVMRNQEQLQAQGMLGQLSGQQIGQKLGQQQLNANIEMQNTDAANKMLTMGLGGAMKGLSSAAGLVGLANGGQIKMAEGGEAKQEPSLAGKVASNFLEGISSSFEGRDPKFAFVAQGPGLIAQGVQAAKDYFNPPQAPVQQAPTQQTPVQQAPIVVPAPGKSIASQELHKMAQGGLTTKQIVAKHGAMVPGKAKVQGDNEKNDTVKALLSPGEIVIPKSIVEGQDAPARAAEFVAAVLAGKSGKQAKKEIKK